MRYRTLILIAGIAVAVFIASTHVIAQSAPGFIYGKVYTSSNSYEGQIRWGTEESFWIDFFNASKKTSDSYRTIVASQKKESSWTDFDWDILSIWENKSSYHQFTCQFGEIKSMEPLNKSRVQLLFKNGTTLEVSGEGYNDIGAKVQVLDNELGWTSLAWDKIKKVEFASPAKGVTLPATQPLFGTVETVRREKFTGYVQWDHDERVSTDKLDGDSRDSRISLAFADIASIEKSKNGSDVTLRSGRSFYLTGTNDVDDDNKGIVVIHPEKGMVDIPWSMFKSVTFTANPGSLPSYEKFSTQQFLSGTVFLYDAKEVSGRMIYDLDEMLSVETIEGKDNSIEYTIPFRLIKSIRPRNEDYSMIELRNGETLLLGDGRDVSARNDGILLFQKGKTNPTHLRWKNIEQIVFD